MLECRERFEEVQTLWKMRDTDTLAELLSRDSQICLDPDVWVVTQPHLSPIMRAVLFDWVIEISREFSLKRETCYLALQLIDLQMQLSPGILKSEYQLVAVAALSVACKFEEVRPPRMADYEQAADRAYTQAQIKAMERKILATSGWRILPATLTHWLSWAMSQWDDFLVYMRLTHLGQFKHPEADCYWRFIQAMSLADALALDYRSLRIPKNLLAAGVLYFVLSSGPNTTPAWMELFEYFVGQTLAVGSVEELGQVLNFLAGFAALPVANVVPKGMESLENHYEDAISGQTHLPTTLKYVRQLLHPSTSN